MGQVEIIEFLNKQDRPLSRMQISKGLNEDGVKISHIISKLIKQGEVKYIEVSRIEVRELLGPESPLRRCKLYYI